MPLQATSGAASYDAFGGGVPVSVNYIEDVFSTYLYTGNATTGQSINNGIDLATKGGLLWCKNRTTGSTPHYLFDTARDFSYSHATVLNTASTAAQEDKGTDYAKPETNGFSFGSGAGSTSPNKSGDAFASWTFRKQPKFFDIQTWTGTGSNTTISHSLGSVPACIMVKRTDTTGAWQVYHRSLANTEYLVLNTTAAKATGATRWNSTTPTSTVFSLGTDATVNASGGTYVAYLFAHDAGGFGLTGTDNVISCGSFTTDGGGSATVDLGYEPQWLLMRSSSTTDNWYIFDVMRGFSQTSAVVLFPNGTSNDYTFTSGTTYPFTPTATGFYTNQTLNGSQDYIYIAIRRGPMKVPTSGTSVFSPNYATGTSSAGTIINASFAPDSYISKVATGSGFTWTWFDRLRGGSYLSSNNDNAESAASDVSFNASSVGVSLSTWSYVNSSSYNYSRLSLKRAPSFFDEVCYTGTGANRTVTHNLGVAPELMIVKKRNAAGTDWNVYSSPLGATQAFYLNQPDAAVTSSGAWNNTAPTSSVFTIGTSGTVNASAATYVAYLFASCPGVSKVGSYTGTGTTLQIDCGFTGGARFVMIKRTDSTGDWYVWDTAHGIVSGNDPYLRFNTDTAEVTSTDYIDTYSAGFEISSTAPNQINGSGGSFIFLAIA